MGSILGVRAKRCFIKTSACSPEVLEEGYWSFRQKEACVFSSAQGLMCVTLGNQYTAQIQCQMLLPLLLQLLLLLIFGLFLMLLSSSSSCRILMSFCVSSSFSRRNSSCCLKNIRKSCRAKRTSLHTNINTSQPKTVLAKLSFQQP